MSQFTYPVIESFDPGILFVLIQIDPYWWNLPTNPGSNTTTNGMVWAKSPIGNPNIAPDAPDYQYAVFWAHDQQPITEVAGMNFVQEEIQGRSEPFTTMTSGAPHTFDLSLQVVSQYPTGASNEQAGNSPDDLDPVYQSRWFQQLTEPLYDSAGDQSIEPPPVIVQIGNLIIARCVVTHCTIQWVGPYQPWTMQPQQGIVNLSFLVQRIAAGVYEDGYEDYYNADPSPGGLYPNAVGIGGPGANNFPPYIIPLWNRFIEFPLVTPPTS